MPIALIVVGAIFVTVGLRGTHKELFCLLKADFTGQGNFLYWFAAVFIIGAIGYIEKLRPISDAFLLLMIVALLLATKGGLFTNIKSAIQTTSNTSTMIDVTPQSAAQTAQSDLAAGQSLLSGALPMPTGLSFNA